MQVVQRGNEIQEIRCEGGAFDVNSTRDGLMYSAQEFEGRGFALPDELRFFNYQRGQPVSRAGTAANLPRRAATDADTNMLSSSFMPSNQEMWIAAMYPEVFALDNYETTASGGVNQVVALAPIPASDTLQWLFAWTIAELYIGVGTHQPLMSAMFGFYSSAADAMYAASGDSPGGPHVAIGSLGYVGGHNARVSDRLYHVSAQDKVNGKLRFPRGGTPLAAGDNSPANVLPQDLRIRWYLRGPRVFPVTGGSAK